MDELNNLPEDYDPELDPGALAEGDIIEMIGEDGETVPFIFIDALEYEGVSVACTETPEQEMIREEALQKRERMLSKLTETQRRRFEMVEDGMSLRHIAEIEGADLSSVAESVRAARKKLRKLL